MGCAVNVRYMVDRDPILKTEVAWRGYSNLVYLFDSLGGLVDIGTEFRPGPLFDRYT